MLIEYFKVVVAASAAAGHFSTRCSMQSRGQPGHCQFYCEWHSLLCDWLAQHQLHVSTNLQFVVHMMRHPQVGPVRTDTATVVIQHSVSQHYQACLHFIFCLKFMVMWHKAQCLRVFSSMLSKCKICPAVKPILLAENTQPAGDAPWHRWWEVLAVFPKAQAEVICQI